MMPKTMITIAAVAMTLAPAAGEWGGMSAAHAQSTAPGRRPLEIVVVGSKLKKGVPPVYKGTTGGLETARRHRVLRQRR